MRHRIKARSSGVLHVQTKLSHFGLITYAVPTSRLRRHIPEERFQIPEFKINGENFALLSVVP
ncbi:MAG: DUF2071 domain-containing protein, partial [Limisphaerales bacterium]